MNDMQLNYLKTVLLSQLLLEANEGLRLTKQYKQNVKQQINKLNQMLEEVVREEFNTVYDTDPQMVTNILNKVEELMDKIKGSSIDELIMINSVVDKYQENKDWFKEHAEAESSPKMARHCRLCPAARLGRPIFCKIRPARPKIKPNAEKPELFQHCLKFSSRE